jgi:hypothetical protein
MTEQPGEWLTVAQAAAQLGVNVRTGASAVNVASSWRSCEPQTQGTRGLLTRPHWE